jgi:ubiquinol-cytochrome c reductase cytochrome b subunit
MLVRHKHTQFPGKGAREDNVVGTPMFPGFIAKTTGFLFLVSGVTVLLGAFVQINPIWLYGPYVPFKVSYAVQPDWYMGWLDGALRVMPSWELHLPGHMIPNAFFPAILLPGITFNILFAWPWIEAKLTGDRAEHHLLDRPRDRPVRTAFGAATFAFYFVLFGASATDVLANYLSLLAVLVIMTFRVLCLIVPPVTFLIAYKICKELQAAPGSGKRKRHNVVVRSATGGYEVVPHDEYPGYLRGELAPVDVDLVDALASTGENASAPEGVYQIPRDYR